ncbi:MAG: CBS domain-containing protein [Lewinellaceae bacterium]|nr:CBS domain-containing protein [Saprospiraceae bacterium]MCB9339296.1 CBS domain-containing protein [Lewinellaceae bacterium]
MKNFQQKEVESSATPQVANAPLVTKYMTKKLITFKPETAIMDVVDTLLKNKITGAPVLDDQKNVVGLIDDKDCLKVLFGGAYHNQPVENNDVAHYMSNVMRTVSVHADIYEAAFIFLNSVYKRLLVVDDGGKLVGQISRRDILRAIHDFDTEAKWKK